MMRYIYEESLNGLKDLKHIEWFLRHNEQYEFNSLESKNLVNSLFYKIQKKNIFYSDIINEYNTLVRLFENNPFNYKYDALKHDNIAITSKYKNNYFIEVQDNENNKYIVPYQYILDNPIEHDIDSINKNFNEKLSTDRKNVVSNFEVIDQHYKQYWSGDVCQAIARYHNINYGKDYNIKGLICCFIIYNYLLLRIIHESQFVSIITHFGEFFSNDYWAYYSADYVFNGHTFLGIIVMLLIVYFIYLDYYYIYGLYYILFVWRKYDNVYKHHKNVLNYYNHFETDWKSSVKDPLPDQIVKVNHRNSIYIPLIKMTSRKYNFYQNRTIKENGKETKKAVLIDVLVPKKKFYKSPIKKQLLKLLLLLIFVEAICHVTMIIQYLE